MYNKNLNCFNGYKKPSFIYKETPDFQPQVPEWAEGTLGERLADLKDKFEQEKEKTNFYAENLPRSIDAARYALEQARDYIYKRLIDPNVQKFKKLVDKKSLTSDVHGRERYTLLLKLVDDIKIPTMRYAVKERTANIKFNEKDLRQYILDSIAYQLDDTEDWKTKKITRSPYKIPYIAFPRLTSTSLGKYDVQLDGKEGTFLFQMNDPKMQMTTNPIRHTSTVKIFFKEKNEPRAKLKLMDEYTSNYTHEKLDMETFKRVFSRSLGAYRTGKETYEYKPHYNTKLLKNPDLAGVPSYIDSLLSL